MKNKRIHGLTLSGRGYMGSRIKNKTYVYYMGNQPIWQCMWLSIICNIIFSIYPYISLHGVQVRVQVAVV